MSTPPDETAAPGDAPAPRARQLVPMAYALAALGLGITVAGVAHRGLAHGLPRFYRDEEVARGEALARALPVVLREPRPLGLIVGASVLVRLDPLGVERHLRSAGVDLAVYNLAMDGAAPAVHELLVRRIEADMPSPPRRLSAVILDTSLALLTHAGRATSESGPFFYIALEDPQGLRSLFAHRPGVAFDAGFRKYVLGDAYYGDLSTLWTEGVLDAPWRCRFQPGPESSPEDVQLLRSYCDAERALVPGGYYETWKLATHGYEPKVPVPLQSLFEKAMGVEAGAQNQAALRARFERHLAKLVRTHDILELDFDEASIAELIDVARRFQRISDHVIFLLSPENPLLKRSAAAEQRVQELIVRLRAVSPDVVDLHHDPRFALEDFRDAIHLTFAQTAQDKFTAAVADGVRAALARPAR